LVETLWAHPPAADGQMGTILKAYREWLQNGDRAFLEGIWPGIVRALEFAWQPESWDADRDGVPLRRLVGVSGGAAGLRGRRRFRERSCASVDRGSSGLPRRRWDRLRCRSAQSPRARAINGRDHSPR